MIAPALPSNVLHTDLVIELQGGAPTDNVSRQLGLVPEHKLGVKPVDG